MLTVITIKHAGTPILAKKNPAGRQSNRATNIRRTECRPHIRILNGSPRKGTANYGMPSLLRTVTQVRFHPLPRPAIPL